MKKLFISIFILFGYFGYGQIDKYVDSISSELKYRKLEQLWYTNYYSENDNLSLFVYYDLGPNKTKQFNKNNGVGTFFEDKRLTHSLCKFYKNSGIDRGHLYNAEDASFNFISFHSSYLITNATPQKIEFNRGVWKRLEKSIRDIAKTDDLFIITGCDLYQETNLRKLGIITIPNYYFKIVINLTKNTTNIYYLKNGSSNKLLSKFLITKENFGKYTGIYLK